MFKKRVFLIASAVAALAIIGSAVAANPKLRTFGDGTVTLTGQDSATIVNNPGQYGGVYLQSRSQSAKPIGQVSFSFRSTADVGGGAPRFSLPIDTNEDGTVEWYAFLDAAGCGGISGGDTLVSTDESTCAINAGPESFSNWAAFAAAHPTYRIAPGAIPFIIADVAGNYAVEDIVLR